MIFSSNIFLYYFLPLFLVVYYLSPRGLKSYAIAFASYLFYGWWRPDFVLLMLFSTGLDYCCGRSIVKARAEGRTGRKWLVLSIVSNLGLLGYFKYANFGIESANWLLASFGYDDVTWTKVILPVGISFYTFQTMSYTIDIFRKQAKPVESFKDFMCYVALFPQLVAGPIVRYSSVATQLHSRTHSFGKFYQGVLTFQIGLVKKILVADFLAEVADQAFAATEMPVGDAWLGVCAYSFQIYFDFSGYSDMAIGLGLMLGFRFPVNFNAPYRSTSITDFWRRWHISLSSWLRDYLYLPLGGNRKGSIRTYINLAVTMLLGGLWHGAAWTFIAWGAYQSFWLIVERLSGKDALYGRLPKPAKIAITFVLVQMGWVFFRAADLPSALSYFSMLFGFGQSSAVGPVLELRTLQVAVLIMAALIVWFVPTSQRLTTRQNPLFSLGLQPLFCLALLHLHYQDDVPFLYYQF